MAHDFKRFPELTNNQLSIYYFESPHKQITESFNARVVKVTDGDSIRVETDFRDFDFPIRFSRIDAKELSEGGDQSRKWLESKILGKDIYVLVDKENRVEKFGRILGDIVFDGFSINDESMMLGHSTYFKDREVLNGFE